MLYDIVFLVASAVLGVVASEAFRMMFPSKSELVARHQFAQMRARKLRRHAVGAHRLWEELESLQLEIGSYRFGTVLFSLAGGAFFAWFLINTIARGPTDGEFIVVIIMMFFYPAVVFYLRYQAARKVERRDAIRRELERTASCDHGDT